MAAQATATKLRPDDTGAQLRAAQNAARRQRTSGFSRMPSANNNNNFDSAPSFPSYASLGDDASANTPEAANNATTAGEMYQRAHRARMINHQIGESVGLNLNRQPQSEEPDELSEVQQDYAAREASLLQNNQQGIDTRSSAAKRAAQRAMKKSGLTDGLDALSKTGQKELSSFTNNAISDLLEGVDSIGWGAYVVQSLVFVKNNLQFARSILSPPADEEASSLQALRSKANEAAMDMALPRFELLSAGSYVGIVGFIVQWFIISLAFLLLASLVMLVVSFYDMWENPLTYIWAAFRASTGL